MLVFGGGAHAVAVETRPPEHSEPNQRAVAPAAVAGRPRQCHDTGDASRTSRLPFRGAEASMGAAGQSSTAHLAVAASASGVVAPGRRVTLTFEVTPARGLHVYAPGRHGYRVIAFCAEAPTWLTQHPLVYPAAEIYHFAPLDERVETYQRPFTLRQDLTVLDSGEARASLAGRTVVVIAGRIEYQACDDTVCYAPAAVPVAVTLPVAALPRQ